MRRILAVLFICTLSGPALAHNVDKIYNKLLAANPTVKKLPIYVKSGILNKCSLACTNGKVIYVSTELLQLVKNADELAGVIGHEMAHAVYKNELKADLLGLKYAERAGYNKCRAAQLMKMYGEDADHPSGAVRYKNTGCK